MRPYRKAQIITISLIVLFVTGVSALSQEVLREPIEHRSLAQRLDWAKSTAKTNPKLLNGYWIGYSIEKYMHEDSQIGWSGRSDKDIPTLKEILLGVGRTTDEVVQERKILNAVQKELQSASTGKKEKQKVLKQVAILFSYPSADANITDFDKVNMSTSDCLVDLEGRPLLWLGQVEDAQSIPFLDKMFEDSRQEKCKRGLMAAVSAHETKSLVISCLHKYVKNDNVKLRCQAVFWLAQQDHPDVFDILKDIVRNDVSSKVRKDSVFWLGQKAKTDEMIKIIETAAMEDSAREVRKQAVFALSQAPDERGVDSLIKIAHSQKDPATQKEAIFWLGQKASNKAKESLTDIVFDPKTTEIHEQVVFAISRWPKDQSIPALSKISKNHPNPDIRKKAIFWLGQTGDPRAVDTLAEIVKKSE